MRGPSLPGGKIRWNWRRAAWRRTRGTISPWASIARVVRAYDGYALVLEIQKSAAERCPLPDGTQVRARGFLRDGRLEISHPLNVENLGDARRLTSPE
ncbi:hypothetical protein [Hyphomonas sp.]|uniref:hypothetical protein n=1 Tax=Hyphomonas sp. TaxID=87 RepID=UPI0025BD2D40|nr:hypothetical protein [Hyphomonas sp.]MBI1400083.1 hypothetical protein [Hyphomonas sp.]